MIGSVIGMMLLAGLFVWAAYAPRTMRFVLVGVIWLIAAILGIEAISGLASLLSQAPLLADVHRWAGHLLVPISSFVLTASVVLLLRHVRQRLGTFIQFCLISFAAVATVMLATFSGYVRPFAPGILEETRNRFLLLHCFALPGIFVALVPAWMSTVRRLRVRGRKRGAAVTELDGGGKAPAESTVRTPPGSGMRPLDDNPYASPGD